MQDVLIINAVCVTVLMVLVWLVSLPLRDVSIIDIAWGLGFVLVAWGSFLAAGSDRSLLLTALVTVWGLRLGAYLGWRKAGTPEDFRYRTMRERNPQTFPFRSLLTIFALQGTLMWVISLPIQLAETDTKVALPLTSLGVVLWAVGFLCETVGDWQLAKFKADPKNEGRVLDSGLWRYTRHPNYFGDFLVWWGFYLIAVAAGAPWWTIVGPTIMSVLLMRVSGVTLLERSLKDRKAGYAEYVSRTNAFFPWVPRSTR
jgi:steroid 5-alpha reductase family enzyme